MATKGMTRDDKKAVYPTFRSSGKMNNYDIIFDDDVSKYRVGFYNNNLSDYVYDERDSIFTVTAAEEHRIDLISLKFYDTTIYDWVIRDVNNIQDEIREIVAGKKLLIPNKGKF